MSNLSENKNKLRRHYLQVRKRMRKESVLKKSNDIFKQVIESETFKNAEVIHCYISIDENNEVQTNQLLQYCFKMKKKVLVPKIEGEGILNHFCIKSLENLTRNSWGVPEPENGMKWNIHEKKIDLVFVPMVAGDRHCNRLGYGKGYYDRFLNTLDAQKTGLLFDCQLHMTGLPVESFDVKLDDLFTERERIQ